MQISQISGSSACFWAWCERRIGTIVALVLFPCSSKTDISFISFLRFLLGLAESFHGKAAEEFYFNLGSSVPDEYSGVFWPVQWFKRLLPRWQCQPGRSPKWILGQATGKARLSEKQAIFIRYVYTWNYKLKVVVTIWLKQSLFKKLLPVLKQITGFSPLIFNKDSTHYRLISDLD